MPRSFVPTLLALALSAVAATPAHAALTTMGSDLKASASVVESHGQDSAFWPISIQGQDPTFPADGQVVSVKVKGTVYKEKGAADPANMIHFQSLMPAGGDGSRQVWLTSGDFYLPIDSPNAVTSFTPENLC